MNPDPKPDTDFLSMQRVAEEFTEAIQHTLRGYLDANPHLTDAQRLNLMYALSNELVRGGYVLLATQFNWDVEDASDHAFIDLFSFVERQFMATGLDTEDNEGLEEMRKTIELHRKRCEDRKKA